MQDVAKQALELKDKAFALELQQQEGSSPKSVLDQFASSSREDGMPHRDWPPVQASDIPA